MTMAHDSLKADVVPGGACAARAEAHMCASVTGRMRPVNPVGACAHRRGRVCAARSHQLSISIACAPPFPGLGSFHAG